MQKHSHKNGHITQLIGGAHLHNQQRYVCHARPKISRGPNIKYTQSFNLCAHCLEWSMCITICDMYVLHMLTHIYNHIYNIIYIYIYLYKYISTRNISKRNISTRNISKRSINTRTISTRNINTRNINKRNISKRSQPRALNDRRRKTSPKPKRKSRSVRRTLTHP